MRNLLDEYEFWQQQAGGLALFRSRDLFRPYRASFAVPEFAVVGKRFHLKPLLPAMETDPQFYVLGLSQDAAKVYEASQQNIREMEIPEMPEGRFASPGVRGLERQFQSHTAERRTSGRRLAIFHLQNFLLTRHVKDYMLVMVALDHPDEDVVHLE
jgi:hypothetical protein